MKKSRFTDSQIIDALKRAEAGLSVPDLCRELGISSATFYKWRAKYGGMDASLMPLLPGHRPALREEQRDRHEQSAFRAVGRGTSQDSCRLIHAITCLLFQLG